MTDLTKFKKQPVNELELKRSPETPQKKAGRPPLENPHDRLTEKVTLNFSVSEKKKLNKLSLGKGGLPIALMIRGFLKEAKWI